MFGKISVFFCLLHSFCLSSTTVKEMSLEEKVGQVLMTHFHGEVANEAAKILVQDVKVGGIIYYNWANTLRSPGQVRVLSSGLQELTKANRISLPLLIAADQEGGIVARLQNEFTEFSGNATLGQTGDSTLAESAAFAMGEELQAVGVNMNLAPVVDINSNPKNPMIGIRSFSENPQTVVEFGEKTLRGYKKAQIISTLKHFPGHGDTEIDSHENLPVIRKSKEELEKLELFPFAKLASSADAVMTAHILVPSFDEVNCSTLSKKTLTYLRETIGFEGVIVSDSLVMDGVLKTCLSVDEAAVAALNAGCDLLILGGKLLTGEHAGLELTTSDIVRIHRSIVEAVKTGRLSEERLNSAVERIVNLKNRYLQQKNLTEACSDIREQVNTPLHIAIAKQVASLGLKVIEGKFDTIKPICEKRLLIIAPKMLEENIRKTSLLTIGKSRSAFFFDALNPSESEAEKIKKQAETSDVLLICSYNAGKNPSAELLIQSLLDTEKPVILLILRDPTDSSLFPKASLIFKSFSPTVPSIQAICDRLNESY